MKIAILIMAMIITLLVCLVIFFKNEADYWREVAKIGEECTDIWASFCDKMNKDWSNRYNTLKEYCNNLENILIFDDESEVEK